jgi:ribose transport system substrate-binding protein
MKLFRLLVALLLAGILAAALAQQTETTGPKGEPATLASEISLDENEVAQVREGGYSAAFVWHTSSDWINAVSAGAEDEFERLGIEVIATTDAQFDPARQRSDVETVMARNPDIIFSLPVDPVVSAQAFRPAVREGVELVFLDNIPDGYEQGEDYIATVTGDLYQMGKQAADALAKAIGEEGTIAYIFHDADFYVTNQRDQAFKSTIENDYPNIEIVDEAGIADPARAEQIAQALLLRNPDLDGIYVTWAEPAEGVLSALRSQGNEDTKVVTLDISEPIALDMVRGGNVAAIAADKPYEIGQTMARVAAYGLLGKEAPPYIVASALTITEENVVEGYRESLNREPPESILQALE